MLSREHFQVDNEPPHCHLVDLGSTNGTKVNGLRVGRAVLRDGDEIAAGDSTFVLQYMEDSQDTLKIATCAACGARVPLGSIATDPVSDVLSDAESPDVWLCASCRESRLKFPKTHPDYLIEEWIGGGGMGEVFRARQLSRRRPVAIKMISANNALARKGEQLLSQGDRGLERSLDARRPVSSQHRRVLRNLRNRFAVSAGDGVCRRHERA